MERKTIIFKRSRLILENLKKLGQNHVEFLEHAQAIVRKIQYVCVLNKEAILKDPSILTILGDPDIIKVSIKPEDVYAISKRVPQFMEPNNRYEVCLLITDTKLVILNIDYLTSKDFS